MNVIKTPTGFEEAQAAAIAAGKQTFMFEGQEYNVPPPEAVADPNAQSVTDAAASADLEERRKVELRRLYEKKFDIGRQHLTYEDGRSITTISPNPDEWGQINEPDTVYSSIPQVGGGYSDPVAEVNPHGPKATSDMPKVDRLDAWLRSLK